MIKQRQQDNNNICAPMSNSTERRQREREIDKESKTERELSVTTNERVRTK